MRMLISLALVTAAQLESVFSSAEHPTEYWIELELQAVYWRRACLTTGGCANPRFRISKSSEFNAEIISMSWSITENFVENHSRKFVSHWVNGEPQELTLQCDVIGMDPLYGFPRTCDTSQNIEIFAKNEKEGDGSKEAKNELLISERRGKLIVEVRAKCFNASFTVQKYTERCPWCPENDDFTLVESSPEYVLESSDLTKMASVQGLLTVERIMLIFLLSLLLISLLCLFCLFTVISKQRQSLSKLQKRSPLLQSNNRFSTYLYSEQLAKPAKESNGRYEIPWDQKYTLPPCLFARNNDDSRASNERCSTPVLLSSTCAPQKTTITGTISSIPRHLSPNSSLCENQEDSGLESV